MGSPGLEDLWQLHFAIAGGKEANAPDPMIANVDEKGNEVYLKVSASPDGRLRCSILEINIRRCTLAR